MFSGGASSRPATAPAASGRGARQPGPPMGLFVLGASNYLTEVAPEVAHKPIPQTLVAEYPPTVTHGGPAKATLVKPVGAGEGAADVDALAATAREAAHAAAPPKAVFHDLKATAEAHTAALLERESEVLRYRVALVEPVRGEAGPETSRTRLFDVVYHGVDGSLSMFEPPVLNSGLMQVSGGGERDSCWGAGRRVEGSGGVLNWQGSVAVGVGEGGRAALPVCCLPNGGL